MNFWKWFGKSRYPGALSPVLENFRRAYSLDPTDCPWVSEDGEFNADKISAECTPQIAKGGVDFFTRRLKLNLVQRLLLGEEGEDFFTEEGNEVKSYTHPRLTDRLDKVKVILSRSDFQKNEVDSH